MTFLERMQKDPSRLPPLDLLVSFDAAARHLSFTKAGAERFLTQSAVSRQIKALEDDLGVALFRRRHRGLDLTEDGRRLREAVRSAIDGLRATLERIRSPLRREVLALTTTPGLASLWLIPRLEAFVSEHPGIDVRIDASLAKRNLSTDGYDLAIRYASAESRLGTPLFHETVQPVCAPALARNRSRPLKDAGRPPASHAARRRGTDGIRSTARMGPVDEGHGNRSVARGPHRHADEL